MIATILGVYIYIAVGLMVFMLGFILGRFEQPDTLYFIVALMLGTVWPLALIVMFILMWRAEA